MVHPPDKERTTTNHAPARPDAPAVRRPTPGQARQRKPESGDLAGEACGGKAYERIGVGGGLIFVVFVSPAHLSKAVFESFPGKWLSAGKQAEAREMEKRESALRALKGFLKEP